MIGEIDRKALYTIGHSNHAIEAFVGLLKAHEIKTVADVRSWPASRRLPHFNRAPLQQSLTVAGIRYLWFGKELGGKGDGDTSRPGFQSRIRELAELAGGGRTTIMCAEEDPMRCHRKHLLGAPLTAEGVEILHIRGDGSVFEDEAAQLSLFADA